MGASCSHLKGALHILLATHLGEVVIKAVLVRIKLLTGIHNRGFQRILTIEEAYHLHDIVYAIHVKVVDHSSFAGILIGKDEPLIAQFARLDGNGQGTLDRHQIAIEPQFTHDEIARKLVRSHHIARSQNAYSYGQIISRALLADIGRSHIDRYLIAGKLIASVEQGSADTLAALLYGSIGQTYEKEFYSSRRIYLDCYNRSVNTLYGSSIYFDQHFISYLSFRFLMVAGVFLFFFSGFFSSVNSPIF